MGLRASMACSVALHVALLALRPLGALIPSRNPMHPLEVSYVMLEPTLPGPKVAAPVKRPELPPAQVVRPVELPKAPPAAAAPPVRPAAAPPAREPLKPPELPKPKELPPQPVDPKGPPAVTELRAGSPPLPEGEFAAIRHKEMVREHLRRRLHYPSDMLQGVVRLRVTLLPDGTLRDAAVQDASDPRLAAIAMQDAQEAGPYPRFPKEMKGPEADYEFLVQYRPSDSSR